VTKRSKYDEAVDGPKWSVIKKDATHGIMGINGDSKLVRTKEIGIYMFMN